MKLFRCVYLTVFLVLGHLSSRKMYIYLSTTFKFEVLEHCYFTLLQLHLGGKTCSSSLHYIQLTTLVTGQETHSYIE